MLRIPPEKARIGATPKASRGARRRRCKEEPRIPPYGESIKAQLIDRGHKGGQEGQ